MTAKTRWLPVLLVILGSGAVVAPAALGAPAEQVVNEFVDEPFPWEFEEPCTGEVVHGTGFETGIARFTDLGEQGHHERVDTTGVADLYDENDEFVGTWTYRLGFRDQFPPDAQGSVIGWAVGPIEYADGDTAILRLLFDRKVFGKGDVIKREFTKATCGGRG